MLKPFILFFVGICIAVSVTAQEATLDSIPINKDSLEKEIDDFLKIFDSLQAPRSYFLTAIGAGNQQFSLNNVALNAQQTSTKIAFTPSLGYYHKSGWSVLYNNYFSQINNAFTILQHSISGAYDHTKNKKVAFGFSFTRFFGKQEFVNASSPYDNDLLMYINRNKGWFQPGIMVGYSTGKYREITTFRDSVRIPGFIPARYAYLNITDTSKVSVKDFSFIPNIQFDFQFDGFCKKDIVNFKPSLMFITGTNKYVIDSKGRSSLARYPRQGRSYASSVSESSSFNLQSIGLNVDAVWYYKKFYLNPQVYFDYYLLSGDNKFNTLYSIQAGFMF